MSFVCRRSQRLCHCQFFRTRVNGVDCVLPVPEVSLYPACVVSPGLGHDDDLIIGNSRGWELGKGIGFGAEGVDDEGGDAILVPYVMDGIGGLEGGVEEGSEDGEEEGEEEETS